MTKTFVLAVALWSLLVAGCENTHPQTEPPPSRQIYQGTGGHGIDDWPDPMYVAKVGCGDCHGEDALDGRIDASERSAIMKRCAKCHEDPRYATLPDQWSALLDARLKTIEGKLAKALRKSGNASPNAAAVEEARHNLRLVKEGNGVHNIGYAQVLLDATERKLDAIIGVSSSITPPDGGLLWFRNTGDMPPVRFDHAKHQETMKCPACHEKLFTMRYGNASATGVMTTANMKRGWFCGFCHDATHAPPLDEACETCHTGGTDGEAPL